MKSEQSIIGLTGTFSSGKDTVANYLVSRGFDHISTGDMVREEARRRGIIVDKRRVLQDLGDLMRRESGPGVLAQKALEVLGNRSGVVSGIRNTREEEVLRNAAPEKFILIAVDAPMEKRWEWAKARGRIGDKVTLSEFIDQENYEKGSNVTGLQLGMVMDRADYVLQNDGSPEELGKKVEEILIARRISVTPRS